MSRATLALLAACLALAFLFGGTGPFGRLLLAAGAPEMALPLLGDPHWKGVALYRLGRNEEAVQSLRVAGEPAFYNRGNALVRSGRYEEALTLYDAHLFRHPQDADAAHNRALVATLVNPTVGEARAGGRIEADGIPVTNNPRDTGRKLFAKQQIAASPQWLTTLADEPGRYLKLRLKAEHDRRRGLGVALPPAESPW
ncbi:MAG: tetratricopeptide repeat protein [Parvibaculaceae bacterium]